METVVVRKPSVENFRLVETDVSSRKQYVFALHRQITSAPIDGSRFCRSELNATREANTLPKL